MNGELQEPAAPPSTAHVDEPGFRSATLKTIAGVAVPTKRPSSGELIVTVGLVVSTVIVRVLDAGPVLSAASVAVAVIAWTP
ncbi:MAG: hypothetical protein Q7V62_02270 [Actinomycetota bacterium]|nr:hypothetical protein [Actinomycetota bacterium]